MCARLDRHRLADAVRDAPDRTIDLVADLDDEQLLGPLLDSVNPLIWEIGHLAWCAERFGRSSATGAPPDAHDISWAWHQTTNLLRALNLLSTGGDWSDRSYGLTPAGRAAALQCLHYQATGPRTSPWG